ncbi:unnamed protein product [Owenia fusiformis]|uniref:Carbonic anhydrase n=1 Tax=Owenia fusiformis TaxID=6347 RepID=A0A8J1T5J3_OWEFU|nr:unnamed protein product [Owenia fusiformis]
MGQFRVTFYLPLCCVIGAVLAGGTDHEGEHGDDAHKHWGYHGDVGPKHWPDLEKGAACGSEYKYQSPINVESDNTIYSPHLRKFFTWYDPPKPTDRMSLINNGHTVQLNIDGDYFVTGGGLIGVYEALQLHFHWGSVDAQGSEHTLNGKAFPLEMHIVTYNTKKYQNAGEALASNDHSALAVLGVWFEMSDTDNEYVQAVLDHLADVENPSADASSEVAAFALKHVLPKDIESFYRYYGSLTTPTCNEVVEWTLFKETVPISEGQLVQLRSVFSNEMNEDGNPIAMGDNYRPTQPLNGRNVLRSFLTEKEAKEHGRKPVLYNVDGAASNTALSISLLLSVLLMKFLF